MARRIHIKPDDELWILLSRTGLRGWIREHRFHPTRRWRFDIAHPAIRLAIEVDGGIWRRGGGAHSRPANIERDIEKGNAAIEFGWRVLRFTPGMISDGTAMAQILRVLQNQSGQPAPLHEVIARAAREVA